MLEMENKPADLLPFSELKQDAICGHLLINERFFMQCRSVIKPEWFQNTYNGRLYKEALEYFKRNNRKPHDKEVINSESFRLEEPAFLLKIENRCKAAIAAAAQFSLEALLPEIEQWLKSRVFHEAVYKSTKLYNARKPDDAFRVYEDSAKLIHTIRFEQDIEASFENVPGLLESEKGAINGALTWGVSAFDHLLNPDAAAGGGSLLPGDTTILLAPVNIGKTTTMITVISHNLVRQKDILFISHEGRPEDIQIKVLCSLMNCSKAELMVMYLSNEGMKKIQLYSRLLKKHLVYIPLNKAGLTVEEVEAIIRRRQEDWCATHGGKGFDMLVCDYPAKLTTVLAKGGQMPKRVLDEYVYNYFVQLGLEYKFHVLCAVQTNREGSRVNRGQKEDRLLTMEDVSESFGVMMIATNVISVNRDPLAVARGRLTFYICKSRSSETGWAVVCNSDYAHATTHSDKLGCIWYRGAGTMASRVDELLKNNMGTEIPAEVANAL